MEKLCGEQLQQLELCQVGCGMNQEVQIVTDTELQKVCWQRTDMQA